MSLKRLGSNPMLTLLLVFGAGGYMLGMYLPMARANRALEEELVLKHRFVLDSAAIAAQIRQTEDDLQHVRGYVDHWGDKVPELSELPAVYGEISHIATASGAALLELEPQPAISYERLARVPVSFNCRGTHVQLLGLVAQLEQLPRVIWVEELKLARNTVNAEAMECELVLSVFGDKSGKTD